MLLVNLCFGIKSKAWLHDYGLNPRSLVANTLGPGQRLVSTKYFTARWNDAFDDAFDTAPVLSADTAFFDGHVHGEDTPFFRCAFVHFGGQPARPVP